MGSIEEGGSEEKSPALKLDSKDLDSKDLEGGDGENKPDVAPSTTKQEESAIELQPMN